LITALVLATTLALFFAALFVYRATGPHAIGWAVIRRLRRVSRWLLPAGRIAGGDVGDAD